MFVSPCSETCFSPKLWHPFDIVSNWIPDKIVDLDFKKNSAVNSSNLTENKVFEKKNNKSNNPVSREFNDKTRLFLCKKKMYDLRLFSCPPQIYSPIRKTLNLFAVCVFSLCWIFPKTENSSNTRVRIRFTTS